MFLFEPEKNPICETSEVFNQPNNEKHFIGSSAKESRKERLFELEGSRAWEYVLALIRADRQIERFRRELPRLIEIDIPIAEKAGMSLEEFYAWNDMCAELVKSTHRDARENRGRGRSNKTDQPYWEDAALGYLIDHVKEGIKEYGAIYDKEWRERNS